IEARATLVVGDGCVNESGGHLWPCLDFEPDVNRDFLALSNGSAGSGDSVLNNMKLPARPCASGRRISVWRRPCPDTQEHCLKPLRGLAGHQDNFHQEGAAASRLRAFAAPALAAASQGSAFCDRAFCLELALRRVARILQSSRRLSPHKASNVPIRPNWSP